MYDALLALSFLHKREPNIIYLSVVITDCLHSLTTNYNLKSRNGFYTKQSCV